MDRPQGTARPLHRAAAGDRQHPSPRRADPLGGAVARPRPDAAGHAGADRRRPQAADLGEPGRARAELLLRRHPGRRGRRLRRHHQADGADRNPGQGADAARPRHGDQRGRGAEAESAGGRRMGAARRPRPDLCGHAAGKRHADIRRLVAEGLFRRAAGVVFVGGRHGDRPEARRHHHRQCARPQRHRQDRQFPQGRMGNDEHQLRDDLFAQHLRRRTAFLAGDADDTGCDARPARQVSSTP